MDLEIGSSADSHLKMIPIWMRIYKTSIGYTRCPTVDETLDIVGGRKKENLWIFGQLHC